MSRSYRKPYFTYTAGKSSARHDKTMASRGYRRAQNQALTHAIKSQEDWDEFILPVREEAAHNDTWSWRRDGKQRLHLEPQWEDKLYWFHCHYFSDEKAMEYALDDFEKSKKWHEYLKRK